MTRITLPDRRRAVTQKVTYETSLGGKVEVLVTFGLSSDETHVVELFCADFKSGTDLHALVMDVCVTLSLLMQHGYRAPMLLARLAGKPRSLAGQLMEAAVKLEETL